MNYSKFALSLGLILNQALGYALEIDDGWYAGLIIGASYAPSVNFSVATPFSSNTLDGKISYQLMGNGGVNLGYRCENLRLEGEVVYNQNDLDRITVNGTRFSRVRDNPDRDFGFLISGNTELLAGFFNAYYDFYDEDSQSNFAPYLGVGVGYANVRNKINFYFNDLELGRSPYTQSAQGIAGQGIMGLNYYWTPDWTSGLDLRYVITRKLKNLDDRFSIATLNLSINYIFD